MDSAATVDTAPGSTSDTLGPVTATKRAATSMAGSTAAEDPLIGFTDSEGSAQPPTMGKAPLEKSPRATEEAATEAPSEARSDVDIDLASDFEAEPPMDPTQTIPHPTSQPSDAFGKS